MGKFEFQNNHVNLDIAGNHFSIPGSVEYAEKIKAWGLAAQRRAKELERYEDESKALCEGIRFMKDSIDAILGAGAAEQIFTGRDDNLYDYVDVLQYISSEFRDFQVRKQSQYLPNRAQRRAAVKPAPPVIFPQTSAPAGASDAASIAGDTELISAIVEAVLSQRAGNESAD